MGTGSGPLKIMYRVDGSADLTEETLDHFESWRGSRPVRIGNGAADQLQLDIYGEAMDAIYQGDYRGLSLAHEGWISLVRVIDWLCDHWDQPEEGVPSRWPPTTVGQATSPAGPPNATSSTTRSWLAGGTRRRVPSPSTTTPMCLMPPCCSCT